MLRNFLPRSFVLGVFFMLIAGSIVAAGAPALGLGALAGANDWSNLHPTGSPSPRYGPAMAYDSLRNRIVLFGGENDRWQWLNDIWVYDVAANTWTNVTPAASPPAIPFPRIVYDTAARRVLLFGVCPGPCSPTAWSPAQVWSYDPDATAWALRWEGQGVVGAVGNREFSAAYNQESDRTVLFGGGTWAPHYPGLGTNETWLYDDTSKGWKKVDALVSPPKRFGSAMTYDSARRRIVLFGGCSVPSSDFTCTPANDLWSFDVVGGTWAEVRAVTRPPSLQVMVYDSRTDRLILFGNNETWAYDFGTAAWTDQHPATSPPARSSPAMVYASAANTTMLFGGYNPNGARLFGDTWAYRYGAVTPTSPSKPRDLRATAGHEEVTLAWDVPASNGGYPIKSYRIYRAVPPATPAFLVEVANVVTYRDSGLTTLTTYAYQVSAVNLVGEGPRSSSVASTPPDDIRPSIAILQPLDEAILTMTMVTVSGTASDNIAVAKVEVSMDGVTWTLATGTTSWSVNLTVPEGRTRIRAAATDTSGNSRVASINVTVQPAARTPPIESSNAALLIGVPTALGLAGGAVVWLRRGSRLRGRDQR